MQVARIRNIQKEFLMGFNEASLGNVPQNNSQTIDLENKESENDKDKDRNKSSNKERNVLYLIAGELWNALGKKRK